MSSSTRVSTRKDELQHLNELPYTGTGVDGPTRDRAPRGVAMRLRACVHVCKQTHPSEHRNHDHAHAHASNLTPVTRLGHN